MVVLTPSSRVGVILRVTHTLWSVYPSKVPTIDGQHVLYLWEPCGSGDHKQYGIAILFDDVLVMMSELHSSPSAYRDEGSRRSIVDALDANSAWVKL